MIEIEPVWKSTTRKLSRPLTPPKKNYDWFLTVTLLVIATILSYCLGRFVLFISTRFDDAAEQF